MKPAIFLLSLCPLLYLALTGINTGLGANPIEEITHFTGDWALIFLLITLAVTPLRRLTGFNFLIRYRRMLGLYTFFYACIHFLTFLIFDHFFDWQDIIEDIIKRPYITLGFSAFTLLIPLAITSSNRMIQKMGRNWRLLHRLIYPTGLLAVLHYLWLVKADIRTPLIYAMIFIILLLLRLPAFNYRIKVFNNITSTGFQS